ncbi:flagellar hook protein FlgE [Fuerstiella marisgermanici]|uniref:Flagellar hook protein FlgE n=1 Tax=Fuerstiella marisgermanici TaxID=1891926 RepID=A0A1P8WM13_9PLAN|nr:flagellar hook-basal body complex protein [Fuerstiella marisgermanici]APZ95090.1 Flagellar hook protein FlgE [Fuerstiella marisgermanici]
MANSLLTGISGLRGHQKMLEVIGNNLANVNTTAFKTARTLFADLMYENNRGASSGTTGVVGSVNPLQVGTGSKVASVDRNFSQGNLEETGEQLDAAIDGSGFFIASNGRNQVYTRAGAFSIDENGFLEDASTGYLIQRFGTVGEDTSEGPAFQEVGDNRIQIPIGASLSGSPTTQIAFAGQLGADATGPQNRLITSVPLEVAGVLATGGTLLNDLDTSLTPYELGDRLQFTWQRPSGEQQKTFLDVDAATTVQDVVDHLQTQFDTDATVTFVDGRINVEATASGPSEISVRIDDDPENTGVSNGDFSTSFGVEEPGRNATVVRNSAHIFDERGAEHILDYTLEKQVDDSWTLSVELQGTSGQVQDGLVEGIRFASDGSLAQITGTGEGDQDIQVLFSDSTVAQIIEIDLGRLGDVNGLAEIGSGVDTTYVTDGYSPGKLAKVQIDADGTLSGIGSNGVRFPLAQLAIATFRNPDGLSLAGNNYYEESLASGTADIGEALVGDRGAIRASQLEGSNVDLALEFTRLLVAQRGFSANARTITVTDEVLEELTNIIR